MDIPTIQTAWDHCMRIGNDFPKADFGGWCMRHLPDTPVEWVRDAFGYTTECIVAGVVVLKIPEHHLRSWRG